MKLWSTIANWGLVGLVTLNVAGMACYHILQRQIRQAQPRSPMVEGNQFPAVSGVDLRGVSWKAKDVPCRLVRIADDHCPYCQKDKTSYEKLVEAARNDSCEVIEIAPQAGGMTYNPRPGVVQLKYVDADIGSVLYPFVTPQTVILDKRWSVVMNKRGVFDAQSLASSIALLQSLSTPLVPQ